jgi:hypothetical protein
MIGSNLREPESIFALESGGRFSKLSLARFAAWSLSISAGLNALISYKDPPLAKAALPARMS